MVVLLAGQLCEPRRQVCKQLARHNTAQVPMARLTWHYVERPPISERTESQALLTYPTSQRLRKHCRPHKSAAAQEPCPWKLPLASARLNLFLREGVPGIGGRCVCTEHVQQLVKPRGGQRSVSGMPEAAGFVAILVASHTFLVLY